MCNLLKINKEDIRTRSGVHAVLVCTADLDQKGKPLQQRTYQTIPNKNLNADGPVKKKSEAATGGVL